MDQNTYIGTYVAFASMRMLRSVHEGAKGHYFLHAFPSPFLCYRGADGFWGGLAGSQVGADERDLYGVYGVGERKAIREGEGESERARERERASEREIRPSTDTQLY